MPLFETPSDHLCTRWEIARTMYATGAPIPLIASTYNVTIKAMRARIQKMRKRFGWFPSRKDMVPTLWGEELNPEGKTLGGGGTVVLPAFQAMIWRTTGKYVNLRMEGTEHMDRFQVDGVAFESGRPLPGSRADKWLVRFCL